MGCVLLCRTSNEADWENKKYCFLCVKYKNVGRNISEIIFSACMQTVWNVYPLANDMNKKRMRPHSTICPPLVRQPIIQDWMFDIALYTCYELFSALKTKLKSFPEIRIWSPKKR